MGKWGGIPSCAYHITACAFAARAFWQRERGRNNAKSAERFLSTLPCAERINALRQTFHVFSRAVISFSLAPLRVLLSRFSRPLSRFSRPLSRFSCSDALCCR